MKKTTLFKVSKDSDHFIATGEDLAIVAQAKNLDELMKKVEEAVQLYFSDDNKLEQPAISIKYDIPQYA